MENRDRLPSLGEVNVERKCRMWTLLILYMIWSIAIALISTVQYSTVQYSHE